MIRKLLGTLLVIGAAGCGQPVAPPDPLTGGEPEPPSIAVPAPDSLLVCDPTLRLTPFIWGVNGHPAAPSQAYDFRDDPERLRRQMQLIKDLGFTHYRVDIHFDMDGTEHGLLAEVAPVAEEFGVVLLPVVTFRKDLVPQDSSDAYRAGKRIGAAFVRHHGTRFPVVEVGNEVDIPAMNGHMVGSELDHYRLEELQRYAAFLRGVIEKINEGAPGVRTIVDVAMSHTYFLRYLRDVGVPFDIAGWHLYADELGYGTDVEHGGDYRSALTRLEALGLDIWITEVNRHQGSGPDHRFAAEQATMLRRLAVEMYSHPQVKAFMVYQLYDEVANPGDEAYYGLVHCPGPIELGGSCIGTLELKPAFLSALAWRGVRAAPLTALKNVP
jgi:hypothetical protein